MRKFAAEKYRDETLESNVESPPKLCHTAIAVGDRRTFYGPQRSDQEVHAGKGAEAINLLMAKGKRTERLIKIIRRKDTDAAIAAIVLGKQDSTNPLLSAGSDEKKEARLMVRKLDSTVLRWISERRENSRTERIAALKMLDRKAILAGR